MPPETVIPMSLWILLGTTLFFVLLVWIGQLRLGKRLSRIEHKIARPGGGRSDSGLAEAERKADEKEQYLIFQEFLDEDPSRADLPKKEQFAAFRKWRNEKGLNWSNGGGGT